MFRTTSGWVVSPTDLVDTMECEHRSALKAALASGVPDAPAPTDIAPLIAQHGHTHEHTELQRLTALFDDIAHIDNPEPTPQAMQRAARETAQAIAQARPVIYQGCFYQPMGPGTSFHGRADFLIRTDLDPATGQQRTPPTPQARYEPWDTKLTRHPGPAAIVQLTAYAHALGALSGHTPEHMHLLTGDHRTHTLRTADFTPILDTVRQRLLQRLQTPADLPDPLWADPRPACEGCGYQDLCAQGRTQARHLSLVAGLRTDQAAKLTDAHITTIDDLAQAHDQQRPPTLPRRSFEQLRAQAALQVRQDATRTPANPQGRVIAHVFSPQGLAALPPPSPGDVFFDMEGFPYFDHSGGRGLEYLFGATTEDPDGTEHFHAFWAHDRTQEKHALEEFVDFVTDRIDTDPGAHVYHYASYEADRLKLLSSAFGTREAHVDRLLRQGRLIDLYTVVKKSLRISQRSYSIKYLEPLYLPQGRRGQVTTATSSIDAYAAHLAARHAGDDEQADKILADIAAYNRDDCHSTARLRQWLEQRRQAEGITIRPAQQLELDPDQEQRRQRRQEKQDRLAALTQPLLQDLPPQPDQDDPAQRARTLMATLVGYYPREAQPPWRDHFRRTSAPLEELESDNDCLVPWRVQAGEWEHPSGRRRKARRHLRLDADPARPHPFSTGDSVQLLYPPAPGQPPHTSDATVHQAHADHISATETCDPHQLHTRLPVALLPGPPIRTEPKDSALESVARHTITALTHPRPHWPRQAGVDLLRRIPPRLRQGTTLPRPADFDGDPVAAAIAALDLLHNSYLAVQGPPGAGKTYLAAQVITHLLHHGHSVGVCSTSHKAIENLMRAALQAADRAGLPPNAAKRPKGKDKPDPDLPWEQPATANALASWRARQEGGYLLGATAWGMANPAMVDDPLDVLIIDEAGQFALADTLAVSAAARNLLLLGDPQQLPQVVQGTHGHGADASALEHLVAGQEIIDPSLGYFLDQTRRMHPKVCAPVSDLSYRGRLHAHPSTAQRRIDGIDAGLYRLPVPHTGRTTHSPEEVHAITAIAAGLVGRTFHDPSTGAPRPLNGHDILIVAPYNLQVRALRAALEAASAHHRGLEQVRVGTVDRFQGQEAPAVICSMTASSAAEITRGLDFVLSRNRLNVAISRAQVAAALVYSPHLLSSCPRTVTDLRALAGFAGLCTAAAPWPGR